MISSAELESYRRDGFLVTPGLTVDPVVLAAMVDEVAAWPEGGGDWLVYREMTDDGPAICRTENFVPFHAGLRALLTDSELSATASLLLGEEAVLYKEKINYKLPGGAGFSAHQDAPAYRFVDTHLSCMVAVDDATEENGCLEVVAGHHADLLPQDERGCIPAELAASFDWIPVPLRAGETCWFHSRTPHRSGPNRSALPRRALFPTYNARREGDLREAYYEQKRAELAAAGDRGGTVRLSLIGDFEGRPVL